MNNQGRLNDEEEEPKRVTINSIERTQYVARLPKFNGRFKHFIPYGSDNLYPQKIKSIAQRSGTTISAIKTMSRFIAGDGFIGMDTIVNKRGQRLWDIHRFKCYQLSMFGGFTLHFNYNLNGDISEITPVEFEFVRRSKDSKHYIVCNDWEGSLLGKSQETYYKPFNKSKVIEEINEVGIENYNGQLFYYAPNKEGYYPLATWDSALDDAQFEAEAKLYSLSAIQNDYSLGGIFAYPKTLESSSEIQNVKKQFQGDKGSANAGGIKVVGIMPNSEMANHKWFTPITRNDIDNLHKQQKEDAKFNIYAAFTQPPILNGVATGGMFNQESFLDAFSFYNSVIESERKDIEKIWSEIIGLSVWSNLGKIEITPKSFIQRDKNG